MSTFSRRPLLFVFLSLWMMCGFVHGADPAAAPKGELKSAFLPWTRILTGADKDYLISGEFTVPVKGQDHTIEFRANRRGAEGFDLLLAHPDYAVELRRRENGFAFILPRHNIVYLGTGPLNSTDSLEPDQFVKYLCGPGTQASLYAPLLTPNQADSLAQLAVSLASLKYDAASKTYRAGGKLSLTVLPNQSGLELASPQQRLKLTCGDSAELASIDSFGDMKVVSLPREELETQIAKGCRRGMELALPSTLLTAPQKEGRKVPHGELRWVNGQRVVLLQGTPEEIGTAHGQLLQEESVRCLDSVLNVFGTLQTVRSGRWFRHDLHDAAARLLPHIPERHRRETRALAATLNLDPQFVEELNVFPELFHCSGFAVFGSATAGGKLYHGRVLDYMTMIGLQDCATTFIIAGEGQIPFANVGYAAFIGSVSGMNAQTISLGEMGGRGEGAWDGVPMATLMRRALEECSTLDEVMALWRDNPRTCEYYYVFAEGKTRRAVGVAARPESVEFVQPGAAHPLLGPGIPDAVVLSAGSRLEALRARVQEKHGKIDAETARWLMCRPVAMASNLHNVLFVPEDGEFYVANADHKHPAADRPYSRLSLTELLATMSGSGQENKEQAAAGSISP